MRAFISSFVAGGLLALGACTDSAPLAPADDGDPALRRSTVTEPATGPWARVVEGQTGPGSLYALYIPTDWNGDAVFYAHGIRSPAEPVSLRDQDQVFAIRDQLGALGYAVAYSSYSENGLAIKDGAQRTHQLRGLLASQLEGQPEQSYLVGHSLGALVALNLAERFPTQYDGSLLLCGMVGGTPLELDYVAHVRALFDFHYPGVLPGDVLDVPEGASLTPQLQAAVIAAIGANPAGLFAIASTRQTPLAFVPTANPADWLNPSSIAFQTLVGSLLNALGYQLLGTNDVLDRTHGHSPFDNTATTYMVGSVVGPFPAPFIAARVAASNAGVARYSMPPDAANYLEKYYVPTGELRDPTITIHTLFDPLVPFFHEAAFAQTVSAAGASALLLQRAVPAYGHCAIPLPVVMQGFLDLVAWSETGTRPPS
jgi:pimeloyl-ACP methyl ester carboxylesterase